MATLTPTLWPTIDGRSERVYDPCQAMGQGLAGLASIHSRGRCRRRLIMDS